jgi:L-ascorbate metabolism protein UlaG (beta-lactamase superfamily)
MVRLIYRGVGLEREGLGFKIAAGGSSLCIDAVGCSYAVFTHSHHYVQGAAGYGPVEGLKPIDGELLLGPFRVKPIPAYNITKRIGGSAPHPKGSGYGYLVEAAGVKIYVAGDTDLTPEVASVKRPDIFAVPIGGGSVMTPEEAADAVMSVKPAIAVPYHFSDRRQYARFRDIAQPYAQIVLL